MRGGGHPVAQGLSRRARRQRRRGHLHRLPRRARWRPGASVRSRYAENETRGPIDRREHLRHHPRAGQAPQHPADHRRVCRRPPRQRDPTGRGGCVGCRQQPRPASSICPGARVEHLRSRSRLRRALREGLPACRQRRALDRDDQPLDRHRPSDPRPQRGAQGHPERADRRAARLGHGGRRTDPEPEPRIVPARAVDRGRGVPCPLRSVGARRRARRGRNLLHRP